MDLFFKPKKKRDMKQEHKWMNNIVVYRCNPFEGQSGVYKGDVECMKDIKDEIAWRLDKSGKEYTTLGDIAMQIDVMYAIAIITVFVKKAKDGKIFQYGNNGEYWELIGQTEGWK